MTPREQWLELAARCEKATGLDQLLDQDIGQLAFPNPLDFPVFIENVAAYTGSLDAITTLIERVLPDWRDVNSQRRADASYVDIWLARPLRKVSCVGAKTEPLARCAAFCRAMAERAGK